MRIQGETINVMAKRLGIDPLTVDPMGHLDPEELNLLCQGNLIQAMKHHRERTGSSLSEAKNAVDRATRS